MDNGTLPLYVVLYFDEAVNPGSIVLSSLTLSSDASDTNTSLTLNGNMVQTMSESRTLRIDITMISQIRNLPPLGQFENSTHLLAASSFIRDARGNLYISTNTTIPLANHTADLIRPELQAFTLDLNSGNLSLTFSETVMLPFNVSSLMILGLRTLSSQSLVPTDAAVSTSVPSRIELVLTEDELNRLKALSMVGSLRNNTYVSIGEGAVQDLAENDLIGVPPASAVMVMAITPDTTPPRLINFSLALDRAEIVLTFSETVDASTSAASHRICLKDFVSLPFLVILIMTIQWNSQYHSFKDTS